MHIIYVHPHANRWARGEGEGEERGAGSGEFYVQTGGQTCVGCI